MSESIHQLQQRANTILAPALEGLLSPDERIALFKKFLKPEEEIIKEEHKEGAGGLEVAGRRKDLLDILLICAYQSVLFPLKIKPALSLVATGGYGRGALNPCSDIDLLFLIPQASTKIPPITKEAVEAILYILWDLGFKVGQSVRSINECIIESNKDQQNKTALMDSRLIVGDKKLFQQFKLRFEKECVQKSPKEFLHLRRQDQRARHEKYWKTPFLQEPNVKESCGGLRDYHNIMWVSRVKRSITDLSDLVKEKSLTHTAYREINAAYDFLHRVRNELHYETGKSSDILTLRFQGIVATSFHYPQKSILRRTEAFMRDYYQHTRHLWQHTTSLMEIFQIEEQQAATSGIRSFLTFRKKKSEEFDGFTARDGRIYALSSDIFTTDPNRMMRLFQHCQLRTLKLSPPMRKMVKEHADLVDRNFRYSKANRETFQAILERKGDVARTLRLMHRVGFLGKYLPEFDALDCLVQHEFFHRYTADEHTLRCIDQLDALLGDDANPRIEVYRRLLLDISDPFALYLAVILHDTGRAEDVREHIDGSTMLATKLCKRLQITGARRAMIMFLVDNHLTFWRTATTKNIEDPEVIAEFAAVMKTRENLDALLLFTFADSNGTSSDAWTGWKESLMRQLHSLTTRFLLEGRAGYEASMEEQKTELQESVIGMMRDDYHPWVREHFERMPTAAFSFRTPSHIVTQVRTVRHYMLREHSASSYCIKWIDHNEKGYTEIIIATRNRPNLLEKICCAIAAEQINILSADFYTRTDGIVLDIFRVCNTNFEPIADMKVRKRFTEKFEAIFTADEYNSEQYLKRRVNFLAPRTDTGIAFPVRTYISNDLHPTCTTIEIQALDRIGLLHDLFHAINSHNLDTVHARICTEKGAAVDTLYITYPGGGKITNSEILQNLENDLDALISRED